MVLLLMVNVILIRWELSKVRAKQVLTFLYQKSYEPLGGPALITSARIFRNLAICIILL